MTIQATNAGQNTYPTGPINPNPIPNYVPPIQPTPITTQTNYEYLNVLNRIADALEKIVEKLGSGLD